jgi:hypothetical protein
LSSAPCFLPSKEFSIRFFTSVRKHDVIHLLEPRDRHVFVLHIKWLVHQSRRKEAGIRYGIPPNTQWDGQKSKQPSLISSFIKPSLMMIGGPATEAFEQLSKRRRVSLEGREEATIPFQLDTMFQHLQAGDEPVFPSIAWDFNDSDNFDTAVDTTPSLLQASAAYHACLALSPIKSLIPSAGNKRPSCSGSNSMVRSKTFRSSPIGLDAIISRQTSDVEVLELEEEAIISKEKPSLGPQHQSCGALRRNKRPLFKMVRSKAFSAPFGLDCMTQHPTSEEEPGQWAELKQGPAAMDISTLLFPSRIITPPPPTMIASSSSSSRLDQNLLLLQQSLSHPELRGKHHTSSSPKVHNATQRLCL